MKKNVMSPFVELIWNIIEDPITQHIVSWSPNGTSFLIWDPEAFAETILAKHFKHANISSFVRQLNMYNFHKNKKNTKELEFYHRLFRRDAKQILIGIKRKPSETDQKYGEELLRVFLFRKYNQTLESKSQSENEPFKEDHFKEDPCNNQNTSYDFFSKHHHFHHHFHSDEKKNNSSILAPRIVLNIILVNKPE